MNWRFRLEEAVHDARERSGVPGVAAGVSSDGETAFAAAGVRVLGKPEPVEAETPFRIASISKPFTATLCARALELDAGLRALLSHTAGLRCESAEPLPKGAQVLVVESRGSRQVDVIAWTDPLDDLAGTAGDAG